MTHRRSPLYVLVGMLLVSLLITSCGGAGALTAEEVHTQYVQALVTNDRQTLRRLTVTEEHIMVDDTLSTFQDIIAGQGGSRGYGATQGAFVEAAPLVLTDEGQGKVGDSELAAQSARVGQSAQALWVSTLALNAAVNISSL